MFGDERLPSRFWAKVEVCPVAGCWLWTASKTSNGYGRIRYERKTLATHRLAYEVLVGEIPVGLEMDHLCRVRNCCNPTHLEPVTRRENVIRGISPVLTVQRHAAITSCPQGHAYNDENTYRTTTKEGIPYRRCRKCHLMRVLASPRYQRRAS